MTNKLVIITKGTSSWLCGVSPKAKPLRGKIDNWWKRFRSGNRGDTSSFGFPSLRGARAWEESKSTIIEAMRIEWSQEFFSCLPLAANIPGNFSIAWHEWHFLSAATKPGLYRDGLKRVPRFCYWPFLPLSLPQKIRATWGPFFSPPAL